MKLNNTLNPRAWFDRSAATDGASPDGEITSLLSLCGNNSNIFFNTKIHSINVIVYQRAGRLRSDCVVVYRLQK